MLRFGLVMGLLWAKTCENGSDLSRGRPWNSPCTKFLNFKYEPPNMHPFSSTTQNLVASGMLPHLLRRELCHHCAQINKRVHVPGRSKLSTLSNSTIFVLKYDLSECLACKQGMVQFGLVVDLL